MQYLKYERLPCVCSKPCSGIFWACLCTFHGLISQSEFSCVKVVPELWVSIQRRAGVCSFFFPFAVWAAQMVSKVPYNVFEQTWLCKLGFHCTVPINQSWHRGLLWLAKISEGDIIDRLWRWMLVRKPLNVTSPFPALTRVRVEARAKSRTPAEGSIDHR